MKDDFFSMIVDAGLDHGDPRAFAVRAQLMARKVSAVARQKWLCEGRELVDPAPIESLLAAYNSLYLAAVESWDEEDGARVFSDSDDRSYLLRCFEEARWELDLFLRAPNAHANAVLLEVAIQLAMLISRLKANEWKQS